MNVTFEIVKNSPEIRTYITQADASLTALGFTEHSFAHVTKCAEVAARILTQLGYSPKEVELAKIAAFMHDIGNVVNRHDHAISGATMAFRILDKMGMEPADVAAVITAIGHHDDSTAFPVNAVAAALILADKTDVRRSRVRNKDMATFDIHDRVNYSVERSEVLLDVPGRTVTLSLSINTQVCAVMDYFEIFLQRMLLCRRAAEALSLKSVWRSTDRSFCDPSPQRRPHPACNCRAGAVFCHCSVTRLSITSSIVYDYPLHSTQKKHPL